ncbi:TonB-dependent receptor [Pedobacter metabolipauper]|uniref:TonB-dependent receptor n=2 Tax=Pedobacter metabolipauper TaxID=425513 RepID=A0A4R6STK9_9SPHI|nr:TonB-dependent receptor [Pedobacter metabolipauper]
MTFIICLLVTIFHPLRAESQPDALAEKVSIRLKITNAAAVVKELDKQTSYSFSYSQAQLASVKIENIDFKQVTLAQALKQLEDNYRFSFAILNKTISVKLESKTAPSNVTPAVKSQKPGRISGKVMDDRGEPLPSTNIRVLETGQTTQSSVDGTYQLSMADGTYTLELSYISFQTKRVTQVQVKGGQTTSLNIVLNPANNALQQVTVTGDFKKESTAGLYLQQKNAAGLTDGISAEQIARTPDRHVGETLSRITGVSTTEGKRVVVRGIAERYNVATLNGSTLPSTDVQERNFEFDLIPTNLVEQVVVAKSITPDMPYSFAGGLVQITTKAVPTENFTSFNAGTSFNDRTMGEDFMSYRRGKYDYFGFDDGDRKIFPKDLIHLNGVYNPLVSDAQNVIKAAQVAEQNKRIGGTERLGTRSYAAAPSQNYQFSLGQVYNLSNTKVRKIGFVGSLSYRNTQRNNYIANMRRGSWSIRPTDADDPEDVNTGNQYVFNTSLGAMLNAGFNTEKHQLQTYNLYTRIFDNVFNRISGWDWESPKSADNKYPGIQENERPKFTDLLQNKLTGKHTLGKFKVDWNASRTHLKQAEEDASSADLGNKEYANYAPLYLYFPAQSSDPGWGTLYRGQFVYKEINKDIIVNGSYNFHLGNTTHTIKTGYNFMDRHAWYDWMILPIAVASAGSSTYQEIPLKDWGNYMDMANPRTSLFYNPSRYSDAGFEGKSVTHGTYLMLDNKIGSKLRLVWGARAEYFRLDTIRNPSSRLDNQNLKLILGEKKDWQFLPSANITYSPVADLNIRAAYARSAIRPGLMENSRFSRYDFNYGSEVTSQGVTTTLIDNYDAKVEWFPGAGEIISAGYFYKFFDKPAEFYRLNNNTGGSPYIALGNSEWAKVRGWEFELRKNLNFISQESAVLKDIYLRGNLTIQRSEVQGREIVYAKTADFRDSTYYKYLKYPRQLYGQVPLLYNLGAEYAGKRFGINVMYNYMDYKTFVTASEPMLAEYERPRGQMDLQLSYRFMGKKMEARLNMGNLTDAPHRFFINDHATYETKPGTDGQLNLEWGDRYAYKPGFSEKFEKGYTDKDTKQLIGDRETFTRYVGRTYSLSISYNF